MKVLARDTEGLGDCLVPFRGLVVANDSAILRQLLRLCHFEAKRSSNVAF